MATSAVPRDALVVVEPWRVRRDSLWIGRVPEPHPGYDLTKRFLDVVLSAATLVVASPVFALCAALVKFTSPGPVLFTQERCGAGGKPLRVLKFRTMVSDAESRLGELSTRAGNGEFRVVDAPAFKSRNDPRVTPVGHYLRRTCLDELPQVLNVLKGDMSLVGPRPLVWSEALAVPDEARVRLAVRPGLTCIWQTTRNARTTFDRRMRMDAEYVRSRSLKRDLVLLAKTPLAVLRGDGVF